MTAKIIDGKALAAKLRSAMADEVKQLVGRGVRPGLAVVLVGEDPASQIYVRSKTKALAEGGFACFDHHLPADTAEEKLLGLEILGMLCRSNPLLVRDTVQNHRKASVWVHHYSLPFSVGL